MTRAARQADVIVPVIAGPTIEHGASWTQDIIRPEWSTKISSVLITKRDLVDDPGRLPLPAIAMMCENPGRADCILPCDTLQGMAAMRLQLLLDGIDRKYVDDPIPPDATAKTDRRLGQELEHTIAELISKGGTLYHVGPPKCGEAGLPNMGSCSAP